MRLVFSLLLVPALFAQGSARPVQTFQTKAGELKITPVRHATLLIEAGGKALFVDPWIQGNYEGLPKADMILVTDIHGDHMDVKAIEAVKKSGTQIYAPAAVAATVKDAVVIHNAESKTAGAFTIEAVPMYNLKRGPSEGKFYHDKGRGNGYVITYAGQRIYVAGDTEGVPEMRALKNIDVAFIPMNLPYTMTPEEAADAVKAFKPKVVYPYHYRESDIKAFAAALTGTGTEVRLLNWYY
ncbi:MAG TPA: MBL fold metallo-hydrolase [Bryobacteraceae bacterium]|nr:MBL fold metallo-hydrolase [Bryobacteraceae bacterium]